MTWVHGGHLLKFGSQLRKNEFNVYNPGSDWTGKYNFTGEITAPGHVGGNLVNFLADFLLGRSKQRPYITAGGQSQSSLHTRAA
ncbi:MAG: hypothetical protein ACRD2G_08565 [Terriglobia bacterium]